MSSQQPTIYYTLTDEAPALATRSLLPIFQAFAASCGVDIKTKDISLAARILSLFEEYIKEEQRVPNALAELGALVLKPEAMSLKRRISVLRFHKSKRLLKSFRQRVTTYPTFQTTHSLTKRKKYATSTNRPKAVMLIR